MIFEQYFGKNHLLVGDCLFNLGVSHKQVLMLVPAKEYFEMALQIYIRGVGRNSMQTANSYQMLGKVNLLLQLYEEALSNLNSSLSIKQQLLKSNPCQEITKLKLLI